MNLADEIRQQMEKNKELKLDIGEINNHLSTLEGLVRKDIAERIDDAYQRGLEDGKAISDKGCEGCKYEDRTSGREPCYRCARNASDYWTAKKEEIGVGDVVRTYNGIVFAVTKVNAENQVIGFNGDGSTCRFAFNEVTKTGEHYNINEILGGLCDD